MKKKTTRPSGNLDAHYDSVLGDISSVIDAARRSAARSVNCIMTAAYWLVGRRIVESEQKGEKRAAHGEELLERLSDEKELAAEIGRTQALLQDRKRLVLTSPAAVRAKKSARKEAP